MNTYEKKYKESVEKLRYKISDNNGNIDYKAVVNAEELQDIFPELRESEDERIRKELITHCRNIRCVTEEGAERTAKWIAWLEKQGKKSIDDLTQQEAMDIAVAKCFERGEPKQEENDQKCEPFRIKKGEWYVCIHDFCNKGIEVGEIIQAEHDDTIRGIGFLYMENKYFRPAFENEKPQVDGFEAELNALLKKYEYLPKEEVADSLEFYLGVVRGEGKPKWTGEDEELLQHCCGAVAAADYYTLEDKEEMENWLKSLKQRNL